MLGHKIFFNMLEKIKSKIKNYIIVWKRFRSILMTQNTQYLDEYGVPIPVRQSTRVRGYVAPKADMWTRLKNPLGTIFLTEILSAVCEVPERDDKIKMIRLWWQREPKNAELMRKFMETVYHPMVIFKFPETAPPYVPNDSTDLGMSSNTLYKAIRKIPLFAECSNKIANQMKRENTLIQQLETLHKDEAELFWMMIQKQIDQTVYPGIDEDFLREAFSAVLPPKVASVAKVEPVVKTIVVEDDLSLDEFKGEEEAEVVKKRPGRPPKPKTEIDPVLAPTAKRPGRPRNTI